MITYIKRNIRVLRDHNAQTYLHVKHGNKFNHVIQMDSAGLRVHRLTDEQLDAKGARQIDYPLDKALEAFRRAAAKFGATGEAREYLT